MQTIFQQYCKNNGKSHVYQENFVISNLPLDSLAQIKMYASVFFSTLSEARDMKRVY